jgi:hypothetical protein
MSSASGNYWNSIIKIKDDIEASGVYDNTLRKLTTKPTKIAL